MTTRTVRLLRLGVPVVVLTVLVTELGARPFLEAAALVTPATIAAALVVTLLTTGLMAWRWMWVSRRLGLALEPRAAVPAYYRSQLLNQVLPGGVLGDVHRAVRHGRDRSAVSEPATGAVTLGAAARAVAWERVVGQVVLVTLTVAAVAGLPSALRTGVGRAVLAGLLVVAVAGLALAVLGRGPWRIARRTRAGLVSDLRRLAVPAAWLPVALSAAAICGHLTLLLVAARAAGVALPLAEAVPLVLVVLAASSLPTNLAGWGPREGAAAWVFAQAGLGADRGVTVAALFGVLSLVATLPGVVVLLRDLWPVRPRPAGGAPASPGSARGGPTRPQEVDVR